MYNVIYAYPKEHSAPSYVAKSVFSALIKKGKPFNFTVFPTEKKVASCIKNKYPSIELISFQELLNTKNRSIVHFPVSPFAFPNKKFLLFFLSLLSNNKIILNYHGDPRTEFKFRLKNYKLKEIVFSIPTYLLMPFFLRSANVIIVNSYIMKELFEASYGIKKIKVIPNGLDNSWFNIDDTEKVCLDDNELSLFYHGRLSPEKGVDRLLRGLKLFIEQNNQSKVNIKLYIAGDGEQRNKLEKLVDDLHIAEHIVFLGKISLTELRSYLLSVNAAIYPSLYEPFSLAVLESFALVNGPVLYSEKIGINDFVEEMDFNFNTFEPTVEGISNAIKCLYEKKLDYDIHLSQKKFSHEFIWDNLVADYIEVYEKII